MSTLVVDLSNKSAQVRDHDGRAVLAWSGVTRTTAVLLAAAEGWQRVGGWSLTSPPDGFWCPVEQAGEST